MTTTELTNAFDQAYFPSGEPVFIELPRYFKSDGGQHDVVLKLNKILYGQAEATRLWYENLRNSLLDRGSVMRKVDPYLFMSKTVICVVYVYGCLFWASSQSEIKNCNEVFQGGWSQLLGILRGRISV